MPNPAELGPNGKDLEISELRTNITIEGLLQDNHSSAAKKRIRTWFETKDAGELDKLRICGDSRVIPPNPDKEIIVNYIAGGSTPEPASGIVNNPGVKSAIIMTHFDGETATLKKPPKGCAGLAAKEVQIQNGKSNQKLDNYVEKHIWHPDPVVQAVISAEELACETEKPVLAATQDHRDGSIFPLAVMYPWNKSVITVAPRRIKKMLHGRRYIPEELYEEGIPTIDVDEGFKFYDFLEESKRRVLELKDAYPDLYEGSRVQNPSLIAWSTCVVSFQTRFPIIGDRPGTVFQVFVSRTKDDLDNLKISPEDLQSSLEQMEFPVKASLENHAQSRKSFASTNTILIDTEHFAHSVALALRFVRKERSIPRWLELPNHKILVSETTEGVITRIEEFKPR
ncbi:MAG: hypothetical protein HYT08_05110 [Candidatus Levybacteria bacterium]|nr:hypothetical protein [Candidatus Levybacteria bacterium]